MLDLSRLIINLLVVRSFRFRSLPGPPQMLRSGLDVQAGVWLAGGPLSNHQLLPVPSLLTTHLPELTFTVSSLFQSRTISLGYNELFIFPTLFLTIVSIYDTISNICRG